MSRNDEPRLGIPSGGVGGWGIIAGHMSMNNFDLVFSHEPGELMGCFNIKGVSQWKDFDIPFGYFSKMGNYWGIQTERNINIMAPDSKRVAQIGEMLLTTPERLC